MAKGNPLLGQLRGSIGDVTFSRSKGQQVSRARNRKPMNPRSVSQMRQRSLFASPVKFFSRGTQALFKFAFEDKKANESDYNAFMRHNISDAIRISKPASTSTLYPAFGKWQMTQGSLLAPVVTFIGGDTKPNVWRIEAKGCSSNMTTWGQLSALLKSVYGLYEGDIVTLVHIVAVGATSINCPSVEPASELQGSNWNLNQYTIDSASPTELTNMNIQADNDYFVVDLSSVEINTYAQGFAIIFSRPQPSGLKVSTSTLINNAVAETILATARTEEFEEEVIASWSPTPQAILEGALIP